MLIETRIYNGRTNKMVYFPAFKVENLEEIIVKAKGEDLRQYDPVMVYSGMNDIYGRKLFTQDVVEVDVKTDFGVIKEIAKIVFRDDLHNFGLVFKKKYQTPNGMLYFKDPILLGNVFENKELYFKEDI